MELVINVTQDNIDRGKISASHCPIALAIRDIVGILPIVCVDDGTITIGENASGIAPDDYATPLEMAGFIDDFDAECEVQPSVFVLEVKGEGEGEDDASCPE